MHAHRLVAAARCTERARGRPPAELTAAAEIPWDGKGDGKQSGRAEERPVFRGRYRGRLRHGFRSSSGSAARLNFTWNVEWPLQAETLRSPTREPPDGSPKT